MGKVVAISASASTFLFSSRSTRLMIHLYSFFQAFFHHSEISNLTFIICFVLSLNLLDNWLRIASNFQPSSNKPSPTSIASYSTLLLKIEKLRWIACSTSSLNGDCKTRPTLDPDTLDASSTWNVHHFSPRWLTGCVCFLGSSTINSVITCFFKDNRG